jgi:hypothetical protein
MVMILRSLFGDRRASRRLRARALACAIGWLAAGAELGAQVAAPPSSALPATGAETPRTDPSAISRPPPRFEPPATTVGHGTNAEGSVSTLLAATQALQQRVDREAAAHADAAREFGESLIAADRREIQSTCSTLAADPDHAEARQRLERFLAKYRDQNPTIVAQFCLDRSYKRLESELAASARATGRRLALVGSSASDTDDLERALESQQERLERLHNVAGMIGAAAQGVARSTR